MLYLLAYSIVLSSAFADVKPAAAKFDPPDLNFEYQLHRQYVLSHGTHLRSSLSNLENYSLQRGETLWGLSQMLYGDGSYWPKVWAQNRAITNPHLVRPGHTLQFLMGSEDDTPAFRFSESGDDSSLELAAATGGGGAPVIIPPQDPPPRPVIKVPNSFPAWQDIYPHVDKRFRVDDSKMVYERKLPPDKFPLSAYVQDDAVESVGGFLEPEKESGLPVVNQYVYVKIKRGKGLTGQRYLIVKDMGLVKKLNDQVDGEITAHFVRVFGEVEVADKVESTFTSHSDLEQYEVFRALLLKAMDLTLSGAELIPGHVETVSMDKNGPSGPGGAQVIGSMKHQASALFGPGDIVFLNKGSAQGIAVGQIMDLQIDRTIRDTKTPVVFSGYSSGSLKVVKVAENCATAVIVAAVDSIQQGDRVEQHARLSGGAIPLREKPADLDGGDDLGLPDDSSDIPSGADIPSSDSGGSADELDLSE